MLDGIVFPDSAMSSVSCKTLFWTLRFLSGGHEARTELFFAPCRGVLGLLRREFVLQRREIRLGSLERATALMGPSLMFALML